MKKIYIAVLIIILATPCFAGKYNGIYADLGIELRTSREDEDDPVDFTIRMEFEKVRSFYILMQRERLMGKYYTDYDFRFTQNFYLYTAKDTEGKLGKGVSLRSRKKERIKELKFFEVNIKTFSIQIRDIDIIHADARLSFYGYSAGVAQQWENKIPVTKFVVGKYAYKDLKFFLLPARFEMYTDALTEDFKQFDNETFLSATFALSSLLGIRFSVLMKNYTKLELLTLLSFRVNIG